MPTPVSTLEPILIVSYDWPPMVAGVRRMVKFARYLPEFGYAPVVVTARPTDFGPYDETPLRDEVGHVPVHYAAAFDPYHAAQWFMDRRKNRQNPTADSSTPTAATGLSTAVKRKARALACSLLLPDDRAGWIIPAARTAMRLIEQQNIRRIITTSYPHSAHLVGLRIKRRFPEIQWVADFRDGWVQNPYFANAPTEFHRRWHRRKEAQVVRTADAVTTVCDPIAQHLAGLTPNSDKVHVIANGYDINDLTDLDTTPFDKWTLAYTGTLFMHRSPDIFFGALRRVLDERHDTADARPVQVLFMSRFQPEHHAAVERNGLTDIVKTVPMGTHRQALQLQLRADALLALEGEAENSEIMLTQKIFEYMSAGKPVLAVTPEGALAKAVRRSGCGVAVTPSDPNAIEQALRDLICRDLKSPFRPDPEYIAQFDRKKLTKKLAKILHK